MDKYNCLTVSNKKKYKSRILNKDGELHTVDTNSNFSSVSMLVPSISHYWISMIESASGRIFTPKGYLSMSKKLDKIITEQLINDCKKSIKEYPSAITNELCMGTNKALNDVITKKLGSNSEIETASTTYKIIDGNIVLRNIFEDNFDEYYVFTDRKYNAKSYKVNIGVKNEMRNELEFKNK